MSHSRKEKWTAKLAIVANASSTWVITNGEWGAPNIAIVDNETNARLIAKAPEMLDFIKAIVAEQKAHGVDHGDTVIISEGMKLIGEIENE